MDWNKDRDHIDGTMDQHMKVNGFKEKFKVKVPTGTAMEEYIQGNGSRIWCMEMVFINGRMEENMLEAINLTKSVDMGSIIGITEEYLRGYGRTEKETEKEE